MGKNPTEAKEATAAQMEMARKAAASVRPHSHNSALILDGERDATDIVQSALAAVTEMAARDDRLTFTDRGDLVLHLVWALKPGQPQIVAVCTYSELAEKYRAAAGQIVPGATGYVEEMIADHAFGRADIQTAIYRAAHLKGQPHDAH